MGIGISIVFAALGAILIWGTTASVSGVDLTMIGVILLVVGAIGALLSLVFWSEWSPAYRGRRRTYVDDGVAVRRRSVAPAARREVVVEDEEVVPPGGPPAPPPP